MAWVNNKPARNSGNRHLIGGERQASEKDLTKRLSNLLVIAENGSSGILADLENEVKNLEVKLEKLNKQQSALQLMWEMYLQKNDSQNADNVKQEQRNCKNEIQSLEILKEQALSLLSRYGVLVGTDLPSHKEITLLWDWNATHESQISAPKGRNIKLLDSSDPEWWLGEFGGKKGYFPASYAYPVIYEVRVLHDHTAGSDLELSVTSGAILDAIAVDDEWCSVEDPLTKKDGYIPRAYVEILSQLDVDNLSNSEYNLRGSGNSLKNSGEGSRSQESIKTEPLTPSSSLEQEPSPIKEQASQTSAQQTPHQESTTTQSATHDKPQESHTLVAQDPPKQESKPEELPKQQTVQNQTSAESEQQSKPQTQEQVTQTTSQPPKPQSPEEQTQPQSQEQVTQTTNQPPGSQSEPQQPKEEPKPEPAKEELKPEPSTESKSAVEEPKQPQQQQPTPTQSATQQATQSEPQEPTDQVQQVQPTATQQPEAEEKSGQKSEYKSKSFFVEKSSSGSFFEGKPVPPPRATNLINAQYRESVTSKFSMSTHRINTLLEETTDVSLDFVQQSSQELKQQAQEEIDRLLNEAKEQIKQTPTHS